MSLNKSEVIYLLAIHMSKADRDLSEEELDEVLSKNPILQKAHGKVDQNVLLKKMKRGKVSILECIKALKKFSKKTQIDALTVAFHVLAVDGKKKKGESKLMTKLLTELNIDLETVTKGYYDLLT